MVDNHQSLYGQKMQRKGGSDFLHATQSMKQQNSTLTLSVNEIYTEVQTPFLRKVMVQGALQYQMQVATSSVYQWHHGVRYKLKKKEVCMCQIIATVNHLKNHMYLEKLLVQSVAAVQQWQDLSPGSSDHNQDKWHDQNHTKTDL